MSTILIVDDDAVSRAVLRVMLERAGHQVAEADGVDRALAILEEVTVAPGAVDLVICDYEMPGRNGLDLLEEIPELADRFVLLTGTKEREGLGDDRVDQVVGYLTKPVGSDSLTSMIETILEPAEV